MNFIIMRTHLWIIFLTLIFIGCSSKEQPAPIGPELMWTSSLTPGELAGTIQPILYKDIVVYSRDLFKPPPTVIAFDKHNGEQIWEWSDYLDPNTRLGPRNSYYRYENVLVITTGGQVYAIDLDTGTTLWKTWEEKHGGKSITGIGDQVYHVQFTENQTQHWIARANVFEGKWEKLYHYKQTDEFVPHIFPPAIHINSEGDTALSFTQSLYDFTTYHAKFSLNFYNVSQDSTIYQVNIVPQTTNAIGRTVIHEDKVFFSVFDKLKCYKLIDGSELWEVSISNGIGIYPLIADETSQLFVGSAGIYPKLQAFDSKTGSKLWATESAGTSSPMDYRNGTIYYTGGRKLWAVNAATGSLLWKIDAPGSQENNDVFFDAVVTIDQETGRLYTANYLQALCYELKE